jgi:hypothetical protein
MEWINLLQLKVHGSKLRDFKVRWGMSNHVIVQRSKVKFFHYKTIGNGPKVWHDHFES